MPVYNSEKYVAKAIESILNQSFKDFEFIIIDDASSDRTYSILRKYAQKDKRIKLHRNKNNIKIARTLNKAALLAKSDLLARMDSDDISYPKRLAKQYAFMKKNKNVAIVGSNMDIMNDNGEIVSKREYATKSDALKRIAFRYSPFAHPSVVIRRDVFLEFGGYDPTMPVCEDIDLWFKIGSKYDFANIPESLLKYRMILSSNTHKDLKKQELVGFGVKVGAIFKYNYKVSPRDILFNLAQFLSLWFMPSTTRIYLYDFLRSRGII